MKIKINLQIFLILILFYLTKQIEIYGIIMFFTLIHELGHMIMGIIIGLKPKSLSIMPFGFSVNFEIYTSRKLFEWKKMMIALAGPIVNILIALLAYFFIKINTELGLMIIYSNLLLAIFNLIPIYPLDGGRILKNILCINFETKVGDDVTHNISYICMIILTALASIAIISLENISIFLLIIYLWTLLIFENRKYKLKKRVYSIIEEYKKIYETI